MKLIRLALIFFAFSLSAFAFDACPTGSTYGLSRNQTLSAAYGVSGNNCIYVSTSGSDANNGNKATPCLLPLATANSASVCSAIALGAGKAMIFKGGETWHFGNSGLTPYTGSAVNINDKNWLGSSNSSQIYYGVDKTWFTGGSYTPPIFDGDNAITTSKTLSSCSFQILNPLSSQKNVFWFVSNISFSIIDGIEMKGICAGATAGNDGNSDAFILADASHDLTLINLYAHGYSHQQFNAGCSGSSFPCLHMAMFRGGNGSVASTTAGNHYLFNYIDGTDSDPAGWGACFFCDWYDVGYNYFGHITEGTPTGLHSFHDNIMEYWYDPGDLAAHGNVLESHSDSQVGHANVIYGNVVRHISPPDDNRGQVGFWPQPCDPTTIGLPCDAVLVTTDYFFNNVEFDVGGKVTGNYFNLQQNSNSGSQGPLKIFNNTWQVNHDGDDAAALFSCNDNSFLHPTTMANNHSITSVTTGTLNTQGVYSNPCFQTTFVTELYQTNSVANAAGYNSSQAFGYSPISSGSPTVGAGTNEQAICTTLLGNSDSLVQVAGIACQSDTTYGCNLDTTNHLVGSCPARTVVPRPLVANWDDGAYQFLPPQTLTPSGQMNGLAKVTNGAKIQ